MLNAKCGRLADHRMTIPSMLILINKEFVYMMRFFKSLPCIFFFKFVNGFFFLNLSILVHVIASANLFAKYFVRIKIVMLDINRLFLGKSMQVF